MAPAVAPPANAWLAQWFAAQSARNGGIVRRSIHDVRRLSSLDEVVREAKKRGWHVIETGDQYVLLCHTGSIQIHA